MINEEQIQELDKRFKEVIQTHREAKNQACLDLIEALKEDSEQACSQPEIIGASLDAFKSEMDLMLLIVYAVLKDDHLINSDLTGLLMNIITTLTCKPEKGRIAIKAMDGVLAAIFGKVEENDS